MDVAQITNPLKNLECGFAGKICMQITVRRVIKVRDTLLLSSSDTAITFDKTGKTT